MVREKERTIDPEKPIFFLDVLADVDLLCFVLQTELLEGDADFLPIGRAGRVQENVLDLKSSQCHNCCMFASMRLFDLPFRGYWPLCVKGTSRDILCTL